MLGRFAAAVGRGGEDRSLNHVGLVLGGCRSAAFTARWRLASRALCLSMTLSMLPFELHVVGGKHLGASGSIAEGYLHAAEFVLTGG